MKPSSKKYKWDFFIAHAGADKKVAENLYDRLVEESRVFLDSRSLLLGDNWDLRLPEAQRDSLVTIVLISANTTKGYYQREEIAAAIALARTTDEHRVVPVYLNAEAAVSDSVPYGLRLKHGITLSDEFGIDNLADALINLRDKIQGSIGKKDRSKTTRRTAKAAANWTVAVFNFANWGEVAEKEKLGQRFSGYILNSLIELHLEAKHMNEEPQYLPTRAIMGDNYDLRKYGDLIPFIAVVGFVHGEKMVGATIRVTIVGVDRKMTPLLVDEVSFRNNIDAMRKAAELAARKIREAIIKQLHIE